MQKSSKELKSKEKESALSSIVNRTQFELDNENESDGVILEDN